MRRCGCRPLDVPAADERHVLEDVAVDHGDRTRARLVFDRANSMEQVRRREPVEREVHVGEVAAAHRKLAAQIVTRRHARQDLNCPQRIVCEDAAQILDVGAAEHLLGRRSRVGVPKSFGADGHGLRIARASGQGNRQIQRHPCHERDVTLGERIANDRRAQPACAGRQREVEAAINRRHRRRTALALRDVGDEHPAEGRPSRRVDNQSPDGCRDLALLSFEPCHGQKGQ